VTIAPGWPSVKIEHMPHHPGPPRITGTSYLAHCQQCAPVPAIPFTGPRLRDLWAATHFQATGHHVDTRAHAAALATRPPAAAH
jgi:hypothetical protein